MGTLHTHSGTGNAVVRPGITPETLAAAGVREVTGDQARDLIGFDAPGLAIPYYDADEYALIVNGRHFHRIRLSSPRGSAKYLSPKDSGAQIYVPKGLSPTGTTLILCEGEFKSLALAESGYLSAGLGGITSACSDGRLIPALSDLIQRWSITTVAFLGDSDTALIFDFSRESVKIRKALPRGVNLVLPRVTFAYPKGIDDCREVMGEKFQPWFDNIMEASIPVSATISASSLALKQLPAEAGRFGLRLGL